MNAGVFGLADGTDTTGGGVITRYEQTPVLLVSQRVYVPRGTKRIEALLCGAGGGAGYSASGTPGRGGGFGGLQVFALAPNGGPLDLLVGAGGPAGSSDSSSLLAIGQRGGTTSVSSAGRRLAAVGGGGGGRARDSGSSEWGTPDAPIFGGDAGESGAISSPLQFGGAPYLGALLWDANWDQGTLAWQLISGVWSPRAPGSGEPGDSTRRLGAGAGQSQAATGLAAVSVWGLTGFAPGGRGGGGMLAASTGNDGGLGGAGGGSKAGGNGVGGKGGDGFGCFRFYF